MEGCRPGIKRPNSSDFRSPMDGRRPSKVAFEEHIPSSIQLSFNYECAKFVAKSYDQVVDDVGLLVWAQPKYIILPPLL